MIIGIHLCVRIGFKNYIVKPTMLMVVIRVHTGELGFILKMCSNYGEWEYFQVRLGLGLMLN